MKKHLDVTVKADFYSLKTGKHAGGSLCMFEGTAEEIANYFTRNENGGTADVSEGIAEFMQERAGLGNKRAYIVYFRVNYSEEYETEEEADFFPYLPIPSEE